MKILRTAVAASVALCLAGAAWAEDVALIIGDRGQSSFFSGGAGSDGFRIFSADVEIRGFAINRFLGDGIEVDTTSTGGVVIAGNHIGLDTSGLVDRGNDGRGVDLQSGSGPSTISGPALTRSVRTDRRYRRGAKSGSSSTRTRVYGVTAGFAVLPS